MTLFRQLLTGLLCIFLLVAAGLETIYVAGARDSLREQLISQSQDAATALGLSLTGALHDPVLAETIVAAMFDRGYYREIRVTDARGTPLAWRRLPPAPPQVPDWFAELVPLDVPSGHAPIAAGWHDAGRVSVTSQPDFAYRQLWNTTLASLAWLSVLFAAGATLAAAFLRSILLPLREVVQAAHSIGDGKFVTIASRPGSRELRRVVATINELSARLRHTVEREIERADNWHREAHTDPVTGLANRRGFEQCFEAARESGNDAGTLLLLEVADFKAYNERHGPRRGDELLAALGTCLAGRYGPLAARIGGGIFVCAVLEANQSTAAKRGQAMCEEVADTLAAHGCADATVDCGGVHFAGPTPLAELLKQAYEAAIRSRRNGSNAHFFLDRAVPPGCEPIAQV